MSEALAGKLSDEQAVRLYRTMATIREFEDEVYRRFLEGDIYGTTHLCQGHEAVSAGVAAALRPQDYVMVTYRGHGHCIARGIDLYALFAELMGRGDGVCGGRSGSMHLKSVEKGVLGSFAIVGAGLPAAVGAAFSARYQGEDRVAVAFFGDGAANIGAFHEALNLAAVWRAPVVFVCENNLYGEYTRIDETSLVTDVAKRAGAYGMPGVIVDGNDVAAVYESASQAVERARAGKGPTLLECKTYRHRGHSRTDPATYRPKEEVEWWLARDPILRLGNHLVQRGVLTQAELDEIRSSARDEVLQAAKAAHAAPWPDLSAAADGVYAPLVEEAM